MLLALASLDSFHPAHLSICGSGVYEFFHPPQQQVVLYHLHANIWWGALLATIGAAYCIYFAPGKGRV